MWPRAGGNQRPFRRLYRFVWSSFQLKLEGSYRPRAERRLQQVRKIAADGGWRNEVKLAGRARLALEPAGEVGLEAEVVVSFSLSPFREGELLLALVAADELVQPGNRFDPRAPEGCAADDRAVAAAVPGFPRALIASVPPPCSPPGE